MSDTHEGRVAVVTGAARGLGQAVALKLAQRGAQVVGVDLLDSEETAERVADLGGRYDGVVADLTLEEDVSRVHQHVVDAFGRGDVLVNVAGAASVAPFAELDYATFKRMQTVNVDSAFLMCKAFVGDMRQAGWGRVVNFSSGMIDQAIPGFSAYRTSKAAVLGLSRALASEVGDDGVTVNAVSPSFVKTPGNEFQWQASEFVVQSQMIHQPAEVDDVTGLVSFLASDDAAYITGQMINADRGTVLR